MAILFFPLRGVPDDEAGDIRELLIANDIDFYETGQGLLGMSMPAIWLYNQADLDRIQPLYDAYQQHRQITQRARYLALKSQGRAGWRQVLRRPFRLLFLLAVMALILYVSVRWVFEMGL